MSLAFLLRVTQNEDLESRIRDQDWQRLETEKALELTKAF
jgi:hypothetical protein